MSHQKNVSHLREHNRIKMYIKDKTKQTIIKRLNLYRNRRVCICKHITNVILVP